jgi:ATP-dependent DNA helicase 2 subunit 1
VDKTEVVYGMALGAAPVESVSDDEGEGGDTVCRAVPLGKRVCVLGSLALLLTSCSHFIPQMRSGLSAHWTLNQVCRDYQPQSCFSHKPIGIKLLGFKDRTELAFEDNVKHSVFIYPDELVRLLLVLACLEMTR